MGIAPRFIKKLGVRSIHDGHHHEYTIYKFKEVFRKSDFIEKDFILYEKFLRLTEISGFHDLQSRIRKRSKMPEKSPIIIRIGKIVLLAITQLFTKLRSEMLLVVQKPKNHAP